MDCQTIMTWAELLLVKFVVPLAWPVLGLVVLLAFRKPVSDGLRRLIRLGAAGAELAPPQQDTGQTSDASREQGAFTAPALPDDPSIKVWEDAIDQEIAQLPTMDPRPLNKRLKRALAYSNRSALFEHVARLIYGTQISVLKHLSTSTTGATEADLRPIFEEHKRRISIQDAKDFKPDFLTWVGFLQTNGLIGFEEGKYVITERGRQFLKSATENAVTELRAG